MSGVTDDPRLIEAKAMPMSAVVDRLGIARLVKQGTELIGPCPLCGGRDRFGINLRTGLFQCRKCGIRGGDQVALVREVLGLGFRDALQFLCGDAPASLDADTIARRRAAAAAAAENQEREAAAYRDRAIREARRIWDQSLDGNRGVVRAYLSARGITPAMLPDLPRCLRFKLDHQYQKWMGGRQVDHSGPCMIAAVQAPSGAVVAVHQTWVSMEAPHGKAVIMDGGKPLLIDGKPAAAKLVRGTKKGGAIRLHTPRGSDTLIMGEGIETTLTAMAANAVAGAAYWAGVDLGNMAGKMQKVPGKQASGLPDMTDDRAFFPPPWVRRLIFIQDGDSAPKPTRAKLESGLHRAMARVPGLKGQIVHAGEGVDLNDVLNKGDDE